MENKQIYQTTLSPHVQTFISLFKYERVSMRIGTNLGLKRNKSFKKLDCL